MKLIDFVNNINTIDEASIIFLEDNEDFNSDVIISYAKEGDGGVKEEGERQYYYLIEVFLAKEFIDDRTASLDYTLSPAEIARRLYDYAINNA